LTAIDVSTGSSPGSALAQRGNGEEVHRPHAETAGQRPAAARRRDIRPRCGCLCRMCTWPGLLHLGRARSSRLCRCDATLVEARHRSPASWGSGFLRT
jgi:hypothetical protein